MMNKIRNFCIIAHIDHGKSTLADRMLEMTHAVSQRDMKNQLLDNMELERERGITIKLQTVHMYYKSVDGNEYEFNLIDTPGHADFNYEVSRSMAACEGALLLIDATQGIQAQTLANLRLAKEQKLAIIPVINKIDMPNADVDNVMQQIKELGDIDVSLAIPASARTGEGVTEIMESIVKNIPAPTVREEETKALIFDSHYDPYTGVILNVRVISGELKPDTKVYMLATGQSFEIENVGYYTPQEQNIDVLKAGEVGFVETGLKNVSSVRVGDTISGSSTAEPIQGYKEIQPLVFSGFFPADSKEQEKLRDAVEKLALNDSAFIYQPEVSAALGFGFRCGFLGVLHMEIVQERLEREFGVEIISTAPSVEYHVLKKNGQMIIVNNPSEFPEFGEIDYVEEPMVDALIVVPTDALGNIMKLCDSKRGIYKNIDYINGKTARLYYELPMSEIVYDFYDSLKSLSHGYSTVEYLPGEYKKSDLLKMDIYLNDEIIDAFSFIVTRDSAYEKGKEIVEKMKYLIPRKLYPMPVQAVVENKAVAREDIPPLRKSATGKGFTGSMSKKKRIAKKITENKNRQRKIGKADVPQEAFHAILSL